MRGATLNECSRSVHRRAGDCSGDKPLPGRGLGLVISMPRRCGPVERRNDRRLRGTDIAGRQEGRGRIAAIAAWPWAWQKRRTSLWLRFVAET
jgi:hypothetical protein